ncbi:uncharacterized protein F4812DRAFT_447846 [Daldinia caldariorum]|uniref:uncharacterized protein n=1 Tax=Daldinia caldariorum TaxID=326644 RepID=UPI002007A7D9|nr:uncharacterized protein F4812DRAFT_447846 [Daldinia caldariorum]KAI1463172.1 hypothetical protein F4812DRAFT_447846 [Daldinia caldariorum]
MTSAESLYHRLQWTKSQEGVWSRDINECERFYQSSIRSGEGCYPVTACSSFTFEPSETTATNDIEEHVVETVLRKAWTVLHYHHPSLRTHVERGGDSSGWRRIYPTFKDKGEEKGWLDWTFKVIDVDGDPLQWYNNTSAPFEISTLFLIRSKEKGKYLDHVFLRCPHDITDGVGILHLLNNLFTHAALVYEQGTQYVLPAWGNEHENLSPCIQLVTGIPESYTESQIKRFEEIQIRNRATYTHPGLLSLPTSSSPTTSSQGGKRQRVAVSVSQTTTEKILRGCKVLNTGVTVTHVFISALAIALSELQLRKDKPYAVRYANQTMINLRPYCREPYNTPEYADAPYHAVSTQALGIDLVVPGSADPSGVSKVDELTKLSVQVRDYFKAVRPVSSVDDNIIFSPLVFKRLTPPLSLDPHAVLGTPICPVPLSSIGNIASMVSPVHGPFKLSWVWRASEPIGAGVAVLLATWDGRIELSAVFDTRYHSAEYVEKFLGRIMACVLEGLSIDEHL